MQEISQHNKAAQTKYELKRKKREKKNLDTMVILPKRDVGAGGFRCGVAPVAPAPFRLRWSKNNNADVFDNQ